MCDLLATITLVYFASSAECARFYKSPYWMLRNEENETEQPDLLNLTSSFFLNLRNYQVKAKSASEIDYPWIARVIHSQVHSKPQLCSAICISKQIFISGARCVDILQINYTSLLYKDNRLIPKAFVLPREGTKQMYDDIGFIIVKDDYTGTWETVELLEEKRTDKAFQWFGNMRFDDFEHEVIGYATFKPDESDTNIWKRPLYLTKLDVHVGLTLCHDILFTPFQKLEGFTVPCYHSCTVSQFEGEPKGMHPNCIKYHGSQGSAIINKKTKKLLGVATWGTYFNKYELPVGFAIPNSDNFFEDRSCAEKIRDDENFDEEPGYYQDLCDDKRKRRYINRNPRRRKG